MASASIGTRLGTRIETGSRHNLQCRLDKKRFIHGLQTSHTDVKHPEEELRRNKVKYMMHKDELAVCTSHNLLGCGNFQRRQLPYPHVITTWAALSKDGMDEFVELCTHNERNFFAELSNKTRIPAVCKYEIPDFHAMGYAMGVAYAHEYSGDTIGTVQIGGLITVQNGAYEMHTGDLVQWYVQGLEEAYFEPESGKRVAKTGTNMPKLDNREQHYMRNTGFTTTNNELCGKDKVFLPKPYDHEHGSYMDKRRIFAKCVSSAGRFEKVDILICTQSL